MDESSGWAYASLTRRQEELFSISGTTRIHCYVQDRQRIVWWVALRLTLTEDSGGIQELWQQ